MENIVDNTQQLVTAVNPVNSGNKQESNRDEIGRFKQGMSGNPAGKKKGTRSLTSKVREALLKISDDKGTSKEEQLIKTILKKAIVDEDPAMIRLIWNYLDGMPLQKLGGDNENPLVLQLNKVIANKNGIDNTTSEDSGMQE